MNMQKWMKTKKKKTIKQAKYVWPKLMKSRKGKNVKEEWSKHSNEEQTDEWQTGRQRLKGKKDCNTIGDSTMKTFGISFVNGLLENQADCDLCEFDRRELPCLLAAKWENSERDRVHEPNSKCRIC